MTKAKPAVIKKAAPEKKPEKKPVKKSGKRPVPALVETLSILSRAIVAITGVTVILLSWLSGYSPMWVAIRAGVSILGVGLLLWLINWIVANGLIKAEQAEQSEKAKANPASTKEFNA